MPSWTWKCHNGREFLAFSSSTKRFALHAKPPFQIREARRSAKCVTHVATLTYELSDLLALAAIKA
jgi:hypothetical protein